MSCGTFGSGFVQQRPNKDEFGVLCLIKLLEILRRWIRQELCRGHQGEGRVNGHGAFAARLHVIVVGHLDAILGSQALKALLQWLVVLAVFQAFLDGHPHLLQKVFHRMGHAPRSRRGHQTHAGNAGDLGAPTGLAVQQWAAHHYLGIDAFKPSQETWKHHFTHDLLDFTHSYHQRVIFQAVFLGDICQGSKHVWCTPFIHLRHGRHLVMEGGSSALDGFAHLLTAEVVDLMTSIH
mmetsp:Transcript_22873/g.49918  ORF Transcript_22873/g.49918 Transcript_22873/m.49918 type:complete len:236 (-) Transcript_22873:143-850(-)